MKNITRLKTIGLSLTVLFLLVGIQQQIKGMKMVTIGLENNVEVDVPEYLLNYSKTITHLREDLEKIGKDKIIPLPNITLEQWHHIQELLEYIYMITLKNTKRTYRHSNFSIMVTRW